MWEQDAGDRKTNESHSLTSRNSQLSEKARKQNYRLKFSVNHTVLNTETESVTCPGLRTVAVPPGFEPRHSDSRAHPHITTILNCPPFFFLLNYLPLSEGEKADHKTECTGRSQLEYI